MNNQRQKTVKTQKKEVWPYPVSRAFYEKIRAKGEQIFKDLGYGRLWNDELMKLINEYMLHGERPQRSWADETLLTIFSCLRLEIDQAIRRSADARRRAAERREAREAENVSRNDEQAVSGQAPENREESGPATPTADLKIMDIAPNEPIDAAKTKRSKRIRRNAMARRHP